MNKRFIGMFVIFFVAVLAMGFVSAVNHDFDDYFSMDIPKGTTFEKEDMSVNEGGVKMTDVVYFNDDLMVEYSDNPSFTNESANYVYQASFELLYNDLTQCYETQDGNVTVLKPKVVDDEHLPMAFVGDGSKIVMVMGKDSDSIKKMVKSVVFE